MNESETHFNAAYVALNTSIMQLDAALRTQTDPKLCVKLRKLLEQARSLKGEM